MRTVGSIAAGIVCGILSGFGIGGGSLLMVWMTAVCAMEQQAAQSINLLYFLPTAAAALIFHRKNKLLCPQVILPAALCGCVFAVGGSLLASRLSPSLLRKFFGVFLLGVGLSELFSPAGKKKKS